MPFRRLPVADDEDEGDLLELGLPDLAVDLLPAQVDLGPEAGGLELPVELQGVGFVPVGDGQDDDLDRRQPDREASLVVLDEDAEETAPGSREAPGGP